MDSSRELKGSGKNIIIIEEVSPLDPYPSSSVGLRGIGGKIIMLVPQWEERRVCVSFFNHDGRFDYQALDRMLLFQLDLLMEDTNDYEYWGRSSLYAHRETIARIYSVESGVPCDIYRTVDLHRFFGCLMGSSVHPVVWEEAIE